MDHRPPTKPNINQILLDARSQYRHSPNRLLFTRGHFCLGTIQYFLEFCHPSPHARVHVRLRTLDVIMQIITEQLDV